MPHRTDSAIFAPNGSLQDHARSNNAGKSCLHPGSTWVGVQRSGRNSYDVKVKIDTVDLEAGALCGTLEIKNLTPELDSLVTFFEGEIVSEEGPGFLTANYGATKDDDMRHWRRFPPFTRNRLEQQMTGSNLNLRGASKKPYLFMRWKERFVLPEHKVAAIHGASFAGLYYVCLDFEPSSSELFAEASPSVHRSISPPSSRPFTFAAPLPRRRASQATSAPSQLAQTRPPVSASLQPPQIPHAPTPPITTELHPHQPRSVSYAAALRGGGEGRESGGEPDPTSSSPSASLSSSVPTLSSSSTSSVLSVTPPTPSSTPPPPVTSPDLPTPKSELEPTVLEPTTRPGPSSFLDLTQSPERSIGFVNSSSSLFASNSDSVDSPLFASSSDVETIWPAIPSSLSPLQATTAHPPSPPRPDATERSGAGQTLVRGRIGHSSPSRNPTIPSSKEGTDPPAAAAAVEEDYGFKSWTEATLTGFYHFACSEPYQQLSLRYVPTTCGGSQSFEFR